MDVQDGVAAVHHIVGFRGQRARRDIRNLEGHLSPQQLSLNSISAHVRVHLKRPDNASRSVALQELVARAVLAFQQLTDAWRLATH